MPHCTDCGKKATNKRSINPINKTCDECAKYNNTNNPMINDSDGMNEYYLNSIINANNKSINNNNMESTLNQNTRSNVSNINECDSINQLANIDVNQSVTTLSIRQLISVINSQVKPLESRMENIENHLTKKVDTLEKKLEVLENDLRVEKEDNNHYHTALVNMQKSLNNIDAEEWSINLVIITKQCDS